MNRFRSARTTISRRTLAALLFAGAALACGPAAATTYRIVQLPLLPDMSNHYTEVSGINNAGEVVGSATRDDQPSNHTHAINYSHAVAWSAAPDYVPRWLPEGAGVSGSEAYDTNDAGNIVGEMTYSSGMGPAVMWRPDDTPVYLRNPPDLRGQGSAFAINGNNTILGKEYAFGLIDSVFWLTPASVHELSHVAPVALNDSGVIAGYGGISSNPIRVVPGAGIQVLGKLPVFDPRAQYVVDDVNEAGVVVGGVASPSLNHAVMWNADGSAQDLGTLPGVGDAGYEALKINDSGVVVGYYEAGSSGGQFLWTAATGMQKLVDLIDPLDPLYPEIVSGDLGVFISDINNAGAMAGTLFSYEDGSSTPVVFVPEP